MKGQLFPCFSRRVFLKASMVAAPLLSERLLAQDAFNPELEIKNVRIGVIGLGQRGSFLLERFQKHCRIAGLCDVHQTRLAEAIGKISVGAEPFADYRELLSSSNLDGVVIATPPQWHAKMILDAWRAGKHVFCETPGCRTLAEVVALQKAALDTTLKAQVGTQGRANSAAFAACRYVREGKLGRLKEVRVWSSPTPTYEPEAAAHKAPAELDWPFWLGPLKQRPFDARLFNGDWRFLDEIGIGVEGFG